MKIKDEILELIKGNNRVKSRISYEFNVSIQSVYRWFAANEEDGTLTRYKVLKIIAEELNINFEDTLNY